MKNIEALVTDLETSKALQEAGIDFGETVFVWDKVHNDKKGWFMTVCHSSGYVWKTKKQFDAICKRLNLIPAFTAGELMQVLPAKIFDDECEIEYKLVVIKEYENIVTAGYFTLDFKCKEKSMNDNTAKQALAKLCLWCKKEGYL